MSKVIMYELYRSIYAAGSFMLYTDTDSVLIPFDDTDKITQKFKELYGRNLMGKNLGEFHSDFEPPVKSENIDSSYIPRSVISYALQPKTCLHVVEFTHVDEVGNKELRYYDHVRTKGINKEALEGYVYNVGLDFEKVFDNIYNGGAVDIDIVRFKPGVVFRYKSDMRVENLCLSGSFNRTICVDKDTKDIYKEYKSLKEKIDEIDSELEDETLSHETHEKLWEKVGKLDHEMIQREQFLVDKGVTVK
jgi:hypothetical protein